MSKYIIDVDDNAIKSCKIYEPLKFEEDEIRANERDRIVRELEEAKDLVPVNRILDDVIKAKPKELGMLIAFDKAIEIVRGREND